LARRTDNPLVLITRPFDGRRRLDVFLVVQAAAGPAFLGGVIVGGLTIGPDGATALKRGTKPADSCCDPLMDLNALLRRAVELGASDIHLKLDQPPMLRRDGAIAPLEDCPPLSEQNLLAAVEAVTRVVPERLKQFHETGDLDIAYTADGLPRFRVNVYRQRGAISFAFRVIPRDVPSFEQLGLPSGVRRLANEHRGLVLVTGATGSGKTTSLAAMIDHINRTRHEHIVTIEDPIEILHSDRYCIVNQREVGLDTADFAQALRRVLRQDPDTILIGELRDAETAQTALQAAESGHLVFSTLHTVDAAETVGRMIEFFPPGKQQQIRSVLAGVLRGVVSQRLLPRLGGGRIAAVEVMVMNARISDLIREERTEEIPDAVAEGGYFEMQTFQQALIEHVLAGRVEREIAANASSNAHDFTVAVDHAMKQQTNEVRQVEEAEKAAQAEDETPALRIVRPAGA
jgi:twitching motility protein PilT